MDSAGTLWTCVTNGTPGAWRQLVQEGREHSDTNLTTFGGQLTVDTTELADMPSLTGARLGAFSELATQPAIAARHSFDGTEGGQPAGGAPLFIWPSVEISRKGLAGSWVRTSTATSTSPICTSSTG